ncbi:macrosialin-like [Chiloscyllium punctatum]|uniref:macrosialin-like n=1 Tax=Chiloscyllium punctatum TaxID=137246 RepID=UPI003B640110
MHPSSLLFWVLLGCTSAVNGNTKCNGSNCPRPVTLLFPTVVSPKTPATLVPPTVIGPVTTTNHTTHAPANHTTQAPANHTTHAPANHTTHAPANHTTHAPANHTTHAPANHTTHAPANHTTHAPANHTTHAPANHTTHAPANHTTHSPANHTTHAPANHTTHSPASHTTRAVLPTSVSPSPSPEIAVGRYNVTNNKTVCAMAKLGIQFRVQYQTAKKHAAWGVFFIEPNRTQAAGICSTGSVVMNLTFPEGFLTFTFKKDSKQRTFYLSGVHSELTYRFPGAAGASRYTAHNYSLTMLQAHLGHSYSCSNQSVRASSTYWVDLEDQQVQVFNIAKDHQFGAAELCPQDKKLPVVIIVVVVILVILILVIVAYLIGRKRHPAGYQSI